MPEADYRPCVCSRFVLCLFARSPCFISVVTAGSNSGKGVDGQNLAKLDRETDELSRKYRVPQPPFSLWYPTAPLFSSKTRDLTGRPPLPPTLSPPADKKVGLGLGKAIQQARTSKGMTQAKLAQAINEKPQIINTYENGKAIPNGQIITKIERALGAKLPRK